MGNVGFRLQAQPVENKMNNVEKLLRAAYSACTAHAQLVNPNLTRSLPAYHSSSSPEPSFSKELESHAVLMEALDKCTSDDVNLHPTIERMSKGCAPVGYIHIHENKWFSLGIFIIFKGGRIPLHDHPNMLGMLKVISGKVRVKSYTVADQNGIYTTVRDESSVVVDPSDPPCFLSPEEKNIHEIEYVGHSASEMYQGQQRPYASFIDFLSPPYRANPEPFNEACNYYKIVRTQERNTCVMQKCPSPRTYWSEDLPYTGHSLDGIIDELQRKYPESH